MTDWQHLQDTNPEPSLLDAIAFAVGNKPVKTKTATLDGKTIAYADTTQFLVQVGRYAKGKYKTRYAFTGNLAQAVFYYRAINIGYGYKKRLVMVGGNKPVLARAAS